MVWWWGIRSDYMNGVIKKHELTRRDKEEDRMKHVRVNNANIEPVFFAYLIMPRWMLSLPVIRLRNLFTTLLLRATASATRFGLSTSRKILTS